jgi:hypothetical protein
MLNHPLNHSTAIYLSQQNLYFMQTLTFNEMELIEGGSWHCAAGIAGGFLAGMASATGNGVAFALGPVGVTWGFIGGVGGALLGGASTCR